MLKNKSITYVVFLFLLMSSFLLGLYFSEIKVLFIEELEKIKGESSQEESYVEKEIDEEVEEEIKPEIQELGNFKLSDARLHIMPCNDEADIMIDVIFVFTLKNTILQDGIKAVTLVGCEYAINDESPLYFSGGRHVPLLDRLIPFNEEDTITINSPMIYSMGECAYDSEGIRRCYNEDKSMTVYRCILFYSSTEDESKLAKIEFDGEIDEEDFFTVRQNNFDPETDVYELVEINKTLDII